MNTMLQKRIEEAAIKYSCSNPSEHENQMYDQTDLEWAYEAGATFALQNQWISVEEALPEEHGIYFVLINSKVPRITTFTDKWNIGNNTYNITHWIPIPKMEEE